MPMYLTLSPPDSTMVSPSTALSTIAPEPLKGLHPPPPAGAVEPPLLVAANTRPHPPSAAAGCQPMERVSRQESATISRSRGIRASRQFETPTGCHRDTEDYLSYISASLCLCGKLVLTPY